MKTGTWSPTPDPNHARRSWKDADLVQPFDSCWWGSGWPVPRWFCKSNKVILQNQLATRLRCYSHNEWKQWGRTGILTSEESVKSVKWTVFAIFSSSSTLFALFRGEKYHSHSQTHECNPHGPDTSYEQLCLPTLPNTLCFKTLVASKIRKPLDNKYSEFENEHWVMPKRKVR